MEDKPIRWGVLGCANIALQAVIPAIQHSSNGAVMAIASRSPAKAERAAEQAGIPAAYGGYEALLNDPGVDAVYNPLPNSLHAEWSIKCMQAGKHVLCEKPLAMNRAEVDAIASASREHHKLAMEALMYRFHPQTHRVHEIVTSGLLGEPQLIGSAFTYRLANDDDIRLDAKLGGGVMLDVGSYCVSAARLIAGGEPYSVAASSRIGPNSDVDETFTGLLSFPRGIHAHFGCSLRSPLDQWIQVTGTEGSLRVTMPFVPGTEDCRLVLTIGGQRGAQGEEVTIIEGVDQYQRMVEHFGECIQDGSEPAISLAESRANIGVVTTLMTSAQSGEALAVNAPADATGA
jgi:xylose dehydrogenase (NAD/NADP)